MTPRFFLYKLTSDDGAAPCVEGDLFTLAICKPRIRATAQVGDVIFGFAANSLSPDNRLIYIARVTAVEPDGEYYEEATYRQRGDCIYIRGDDGRFRVRSDARHHECGTLLRNDLGSFPDYERARVLLSEEFRYFGSSEQSPTVDLGLYSSVRTLLRRLGQGHRVNHSTEVEGELRQLLRSVWSDHSSKVLGAPTSQGCTAGERSTLPPARRSCG